MIILGIETSCDETSAAIIRTDKDKPFVELLSNISSTSLQLHAKTGGIIPEIAAREQIKYIIPVIKQAIEQAFSKSHMGQKGKTSGSFGTFGASVIDAIAVTYGPGLIGSLLVGVETAKTLAYAWNKPLIPVNHLFGHIYANWLIANSVWHMEENKKQYTINNMPYEEIKFPAIALVVSGGHTDLVLMKNHRDVQWLGGTRDDAAGEAIDKIGRNLSFPYPAGPAFEKAAAQGDPKAYRFPRPIMHDGNYDFSFSGLKTATIREIAKNIPSYGAVADRPGWVTNSTDKTSPDVITKLDQNIINNVARGVQDAIIDVLTYKTLKAAEEFSVSSILLSGGVAANGKLREVFQEKINNKHLAVTLHVPDKSLCTDNAAMIAAAGFYNYHPVPWKEVTANPELYFD